MRIRFLIIFAVLSFTSQILFSIYYSIKIVDENTRFNEQQENLQKLTINQQHLEIEKAKRQSLSSLIIDSQKLLLSPIKSTIDLTK